MKRDDESISDAAERLINEKDYAVSLVKEFEEELELATSAINAFELYRGAYKSRNQEKNLASVKGLLNSLRKRNDKTKIL